MKSIYSVKNVINEVRESLRLSASLIASQIIFGLSGFIATLMIAHLGKEALAANALVWAVFIALILFFIGIFNAVSILVAHSYGADDVAGVRTITIQGVIIAIISTVPMIAGILLAPKILVLTGQDPEIIKLATPYFRSFAWCILPLNIVIVLEQFIVGVGLSRFVLLVSMLEVPLDILFFYMFIFGKLGAPKVGLVGIGYGHAFALTVTLFIVSAYVYWSKKCRKYAIFSAGIKINTKFLWEIIRVGLPIGLMITVEVALFATIAYMMGKFGTEVLAAHQIAYQYYVLGLAVIFGLSTGASIRAGHEVGRNDKNALLLAVYVNIALSFICMVVTAIVYNCFATFLIGLDIDIHAHQNQVIVKHAIIFLSIASILFLVDSVRFVLISILRGLKDTKYSLVVSVITFWLIGFPVAYLLAFTFHFGGAGIWWGLVIGIFSAMIILMVRFYHLINRVDLKQLITKERLC